MTEILATIGAGCILAFFVFMGVIIYVVFYD